MEEDQGEKRLVGERNLDRRSSRAPPMPVYFLLRDFRLMADEVDDKL